MQICRNTTGLYGDEVSSDTWPGETRCQHVVQTNKLLKTNRNGSQEENKLTIYDGSINYDSCQVWIRHSLVQNKSSDTKREKIETTFWEALNENNLGSVQENL